MRLNFVWEFRANEMDARLIIDLVIAVIALLAGVFFDPLVKTGAITKHFAVLHHQGFGAGQVIWCAFWALYIVWTISQLVKWGER